MIFHLLIDTNKRVVTYVYYSRMSKTFLTFDMINTKFSCMSGHIRDTLGGKGLSDLSFTQKFE